MASRIFRILLLVTVAGLLAMHGINAGATATHGNDGEHATSRAQPADAPAFGSDAVVATEPATQDGAGGGLLHVAASCVVALVAAVAFGYRRPLPKLGEKLAVPLTDLHGRSLFLVDRVLHPPPPAWVRLCVIRT